MTEQCLAKILKYPGNLPDFIIRRFLRLLITRRMIIDMPMRQKNKYVPGLMRIHFAMASIGSMVWKLLFEQSIGLWHCNGYKNGGVPILCFIRN